MNLETRKQEIVSSIKSGSKTTYHRSEVLPELLALQQEIVTMTFNQEHADLADLKIWDVERHLVQMNEDCEGVASEELVHFQSGCRQLANLIKAEISGNWGETKAFSALDRVCAEHMILKNVELSEENQRTEIDAVLISHKGAFIIEVKNTKRNIFIDHDGSYYRTGRYLRFDSNIAERLRSKEELLKKALCKAGLEKIEIFKIVVFTNNRIEVANQCEGLQTCFLGQLPYMIDGWKKGGHISSEEMKQAAQAVEEARCYETYPLELDVERFISDYAELMSKLEAASMGWEEEPEVAPPVTEPVRQESRLISILSTLFSAKHLRAAGTAAAIGITVASTIARMKISY